MHKFRRRIGRYYKEIITSIGFIPTLIAGLFLILLFIFLTIDGSQSGKDLRDAIPLLHLESTQTAHAMLTTIVGGIISLTVLSFSMVMVVLGQATSNYSPKLLRGLVADKSHQVVLGCYLGTTIYCLLLLLIVRKESLFGYVPGLSVFMALVFGIICLVLFVYFIHTTSESIQISNIIHKIYHRTKKELIAQNREQQIHDKSPEITINENDYQWYGFPAQESGYFQGMSKKNLLKIAQEQNTIVKVEAKTGSYTLQKSLLFSTNKPFPEDSEVCERIGSYFNFYNEELISVNAFYGYRQLMEVAVKALSPGINDPGTAINCIHHITDLLSLRMQLKEEKYLTDNDGAVRLILKPHTFSSILDLCFDQIRRYGNRDLTILEELMKMLKILKPYDQEHKHHEALQKQAYALREDANRELKNSSDREYFNTLIRLLNEDHYFTLSPLKIHISD